MIILFFSTFSKTYHVEISLMGFLIALFSIFTLLSPVFGNLSDQYGRKRFLTLGLTVFAIGSGLMALAQNWMHVLIARALSGLATAIFYPALLAILGDKYSYEKRTRAMGLVRLSWPIAFVLGVPLVGYSIEHLNWRLPFVILTVIALVTAVIINLMDSFKEKTDHQQPTARLEFRHFKTVLLNRSALSGLLLMLLAAGSIEGIFAYFPTWMETRFQIGETEISLVYAFMGLGTLFGTLLAAGIGDKIGPKRCAITGLTVATGCMVLLSNFSPIPILVILWLILLGTSFDLSMTVIPVLLTQSASDAKGTVLSLNQALNALGTSVGAALSGILWMNYGYAVLGMFFASTSLMGAVIGYINIQVEGETEQENQLPGYSSH